MSGRVLLIGALAMAVVACGKDGSETSQGTASQTTEVSTDAPAQSPSDQMHAVMMRPMENMDTTGNVDRDFATMMAEHHQQGVDMAKIQVEHGKDEVLKSLAQNIVEKQAAEREKLLQLAQAEDATGTDKDGSKQLHEAAMMPMPDMRMSGDVDKDFAKMMAHHHEMAIKMAQLEVIHGKNPEVKKMAQTMIDDQSKEREVLERHAGS